MKYLIVIFALILFSSCQEEVVLDLDTLEPIPVIEAIWTDNSAINQVKITLSKDYYQEGDNEVVENADVSIRNIDSGGVVIFFYSPANKKYLSSGWQRFAKVTACNGCASGSCWAGRMPPNVS